MTYQTLIIVLVSLLVPTATMVAFSKRKFEEILPLTIFAIVTSLYIFAAFDILRLGFYIIIAIMVVSSGISFFQIRKQTQLFIDNFFTPGLLIYAFCCSLIYLFIKDYFFQAHDVFSHWGLAAKNIFQIDALPIGPDANTVFQDYPPATYLFQYWLLRVTGSYTEALVTYSMSLWGFALLIPMFKGLKWGNNKLVVYSVLFCLVFPLVLLWWNDTYFAQIFYTLATVDFLMGLLFGYVLFSVISLRKNASIWEFSSILLAIFVLVLIKKVGAFLAIMALAISIVDLTISKKNLYFSGEKKLAIAKITCCFLLSIVIAFYSWEAILLTYDASRVTMNSAHSGFIAKLIAGEKIEFPAHAAQVMKIYITALYSKPLTGGAVQLSFVAIACLMSAYIIFMYYQQNNSVDKRRIRYVSLAFALFACIYLLGHILMYLTILSEGESLGLSSFRRYLAPVVLGGMYVISGLILYRSFKVPNVKSQLSLVLLTIFMLLSVDLKSFDVSTYREHLSKRIEFENVISPISQLLTSKGQNNRVCFLEPVSSDNFYSIALSINYMSAPVKVERFIMYPIADEASRDWHIYRYSNFILESCDSVVAFFGSNNDNDIDDYYYAPFSNKPQFLGYYTVEKSSEKKLTFTLSDCSMCGRYDIFESVDRILKKK